MVNSEATLKPTIYLKFKLAEPVPTFNSNDGSNILVNVGEGIGKSLDSSLPFDGVTILNGWDEIYTSADGKYSHLNCKLFCRTKSNKPFVIKYNGTMLIEGDVADILGQKGIKSMDYKDGYVTANMTFDLDSEAEKEIGWVNRHNLIGRGKFSRDESNQLFIEYLVHRLE